MLFVSPDLPFCQLLEMPLFHQSEQLNQRSRLLFEGIRPRSDLRGPCEPCLVASSLASCASRTAWRSLYARRASSRILSASARSSLQYNSSRIILSLVVPISR